MYNNNDDNSHGNNIHNNSNNINNNDNDDMYIINMYIYIIITYYHLISFVYMLCKCAQGSFVRTHAVTTHEALSSSHPWPCSRSRQNRARFLLSLCHPSWWPCKGCEGMRFCIQEVDQAIPWRPSWYEIMKLNAPLECGHCVLLHWSSQQPLPTSAVSKQLRQTPKSANRCTCR